MKVISYIKEKYLIEAIILLIVAIIIAETLFINPIMGKYDNGDFARFMIYGGLTDTAKLGKDIYHFNPKYIISNFGILFIFYNDWVSGVILFKIALVISFLFSGFSNIFDIRYLGFVYSVVFLTAIFLILSFKKLSPMLKIVAGIFIILFFTDTSYITYFNSFYGEAGTIVFFFLSLGTYLMLITKDEPKIGNFIYFFIASAAFLTSKSQELPLLVFMLLIYIGLYVYYKDKKYRKSIVISSVLVILLCLAAYLSLTNTINENNIYQAVFRGILINSKNPEKDLEKLGLNKKLIAYHNDDITFYNRNGAVNPVSDYMQKNFYSKMSPVKVLEFYFKNPDRMWQEIVEAAKNSYGFSMPSKANFECNKFTKNKLANSFRSYLAVKGRKIYGNIWVYIVFSSLYILIVIAYFIKKKDRVNRLLMLMLLFIMSAGSSQFILPYIGSGGGDLKKHLFLLNLSYDAMLGISLVWLVYIVKYGVLKLKAIISNRPASKSQ